MKKQCEIKLYKSSRHRVQQHRDAKYYSEISVGGDALKAAGVDLIITIFQASGRERAQFSMGTKREAGNNMDSRDALTGNS